MKTKTKICVDCGIKKLFPEFNKDMGNPDNKKNQCKECLKEYRTKTKARKAETNKALYHKKREEILKKDRIRYQKNKEKIKERSRLWYLKNKVRKAETGRIRYQKNKENGKK